MGLSIGMIVWTLGCLFATVANVRLFIQRIDDEDARLKDQEELKELRYQLKKQKFKGSTVSNEEVFRELGDPSTWGEAAKRIETDNNTPRTPWVTRERMIEIADKAQDQEEWPTTGRGPKKTS